MTINFTKSINVSLIFRSYIGIFLMSISFILVGVLAQYLKFIIECSLTLLNSMIVGSSFLWSKDVVTH